MLTNAQGMDVGQFVNKDWGGWAALKFYLDHAIENLAKARSEKEGVDRKLRAKSRQVDLLRRASTPKKMKLSVRKIYSRLLLLGCDRVTYSCW